LKRRKRERRLRCVTEWRQKKDFVERDEIWRREKKRREEKREEVKQEKRRVIEDTWQ